MKRSTLRLITLLIILLLVNSPNPYLGSVIIYGISFFYLISNRFKLQLSDFEIQILKVLFGIWLVMLVSFLLHYSSMNNLFWGVLTFSVVLVFPIIIKEMPVSDIIRVFKYFVIVQLIFMLIQYISLVFRLGTLNVYEVTHGSAGDIIAGTSIGFSSVIAVTLFLISFIFLQHAKFDRKSYSWAALAFILACLPSYIAAVGVAFIAILLYFGLKLGKDFFLRFKVSKVFWFLLPMIALGLLFMLSQWANVIYAVNIMSAILSNAPPNKVIAYHDILASFPSKYPLDYFLGVGFGNYSSRAAFIVGGDYFPQQPWFIPATPSIYYNEFMHPLYNLSMHDRIIGNVVGTSMINAPFSQIITFIGEGGIISLLLFFLLMYKCFLNFIRMNMIVIALLFFVGIMFLDNWLAFPSVGVMFWLLIIYGENIKGQYVINR